MKRSDFKNTPQIRAAICELVEAGLSVNRAAGKVKVHHSTVAEWRKQDPKFDADVLNAEAAFIKAQVENIKTAAKNGSWQASAWLLERKHPTEFSQPQIQLQQNNVSVTYEDLNDVLKRVASSPEAQRMLDVLAEPPIATR